MDEMRTYAVNDRRANAVARLRTLLGAIVLTAAPVVADEVYLKGGGQLSGQIVGHTDDSVTVDIGAGKMTVKLSNVVRIEEGTSPVEEFKARAAKIAADDGEGWRELARFAADEGLSTQARQAWSKVVAVLPDDAEANRGLGRVQHDGRWMSGEDAYRAQGYVDFEGQWMTPAEQQSILADRQAREKADQEAMQAQIAADDAAAREREAAEAREDAQRDSYGTGDLPQLGDPVDPGYWGGGWGYPSSWPVRPGVPSDPNRPILGPGHAQPRPALRGRP
jgi:hypothetical protein